MIERASERILAVDRKRSTSGGGGGERKQTRADRREMNIQSIPSSDSTDARLVNYRQLSKRANAFEMNLADYGRPGGRRGGRRRRQ